jgi:hypothetical protein
MDKKPYPSESQERFIVRLPDGMRDLIADEAKKSNRSMNAEVVARLQQSFDGATGSAEIERLRFENATLQQMVEGKSLGTDLAAILAVTLAGQTLGMIDTVQASKTTPRELQSLRSFAELVLAKQPMDWPAELMRAYEAAPGDAAGAKAKRELEVLRRIGQSLTAYYQSKFNRET